MEREERGMVTFGLLSTRGGEEHLETPFQRDEATAERTVSALRGNNRGAEPESEVDPCITM